MRLPGSCRGGGTQGLLLAGVCLAAVPSTASGCPGGGTAAPSAREATLAQIQEHVRQQGKTVLTFAGYSGAGYQDPALLRAHLARMLDAHDPSRTLVNAGATADGIGAVYELARARGYATMGIVSTQARVHGVPPSPCVDQVFYVADESWGGRLADVGGLSPTSAAMVAISDALVIIGGGQIAADEGLAARAAGKPVRFIPADMDHERARAKALRHGAPVPTDFRGQAHSALAGP